MPQAFGRVGGLVSAQLALLHAAREHALPSARNWLAVPCPAPPVAPCHPAIAWETVTSSSTSAAERRRGKEQVGSAER